MPRIQPETGLVGAGVGGGIVSIHGLDFSHVGGCAVWLSADELLFLGPLENRWSVLKYDRRDQRVTRQSEIPANFLAASNGRWGAQAMTQGGALYDGHPKLPDGTRLSLQETDGRGASADGTIATTPENGLGFVLHTDGFQTPTIAPGHAAYGLTVVGPQHALWPVGQGWQTLNLPVPLSLGTARRACWCAVHGDLWIVHWLDNVGLVARPIDSRRGIIVERGNAFHYDAIAWQGSIRVAWSTGVGERPEETRVQDLNLSALEDLINGPVPGPIPEVPVLTPWPRKLWTVPFYSHHLRYGDTPLNQHAGNAIWTVGEELDRIRAMAWPMVVAVGPDTVVPEINLDLTVAWWVSGFTLEDLEVQVRAALTRPEKPIIAYLDQRGWPAQRPSWVTNRVWLAPQVYRNAGESLLHFEQSIQTDLSRVAGYGGYFAITPAFYTRNKNADGSPVVPVSQITECMPFYERWIRQYNIVAIMPFADRRPSGMLDHPAFKGWALAFARAAERPSRWDYWQSENADPDFVLSEKLKQSTANIALNQAEKTRLLTLLGYTAPDPPPPPPHPFDGLALSIAHWAERNMDARQEDAFTAGGKPGIQRVQMHWNLERARRLREMGIDASLEFYDNPVPGTDWRYSPDILLITNGDVVRSIKTIAGKGQAWHDERGLPNWTFGEPSWQEQSPPNPDDRRNPATVNLGPAPWVSQPEGMTPELQQFVLDRLEMLKTIYPEAWGLAHRHIDINGDPTGVSEDEAMHFSRIVAWNLYSTVSPRFGLNGKRGDANSLSMDVFAYMLTPPDVRDVLIIDYIVNAGLDSAYIAWTDQTEASRPHGGGIWVQPTKPAEYFL